MNSPFNRQEEAEEGGEEDAAAGVNIHDLLQPLHAGPCLVKTKDWWTYEVRGLLPIINLYVTILLLNRTFESFCCLFY